MGMKFLLRKVVAAVRRPLVSERPGIATRSRDPRPGTSGLRAPREHLGRGGRPALAHTSTCSQPPPPASGCSGGSGNATDSATRSQEEARSSGDRISATPGRLTFRSAEQFEHGGKKCSGEVVQAPPNWSWWAVPTLGLLVLGEPGLQGSLQPASGKAASGARGQIYVLAHRENLRGSPTISKMPPDENAGAGVVSPSSPRAAPGQGHWNARPGRSVSTESNIRS